MCVSVLYHCVSFSTTVYQYFHQCQYFQHCVSMCVRMCTTVSVFPQLCVCISTTVSVCVCVRVCQHLYHCVSISTTVCQYFHRCQYFQHGVSVSSTVSVNTVSVCPCNGVSSQSIVSCSAVKYPSHTHTHTHSGAGGTGPVYADSELAHNTAGPRHCRTQILTAAAKGPRPPPALAHTTATSVGHRQKLLHHVFRPPTGPRLHHIPPQCGLAWLVWACFVGW